VTDSGAGAGAGAAHPERRRGASFSFRDQVVLVTGVGRVGQIGHAVATGFADAGARLVLADRQAVMVAERAKEFTARGVTAVPAAGDLTEPDVAQWIVERATNAFGRLDVLVNVAGGLTAVGPMLEMDPEVIDRETSINVRTMYLASRAAATVMMKQQSGAIVSFASIAALQAKPQMAAYSAAKAGVAALTRAFALELRDHGIRVNAVAPGTVRTADNVAASQGDAGVRWVEMDDIVHAVMYLASDWAAGITGHVLPVSLGEA
jgi:NAD(P)-dependent dehydrogenase (short-subunit alcohol dehydrogenase family)